MRSVVGAVSLALIALCALQTLPVSESVAVLPRGSSRSIARQQQRQQRSLLQNDASKPEKRGKQWVVVPSRHVKGNDIQCNGENYCRLCGWTVSDVIKECNRRPDCVAFTTEPSNECAYLKSAAPSTETGEEFVTYCNPARGADCKGDFYMYPNTDLPGVGDFSCDPGDTACFRGGTIQKVASECTKMTDCKGFVTTDKSNSRGVGGFLKNKVEPRQKSQGLDLYVSTSADSGESSPGDPTVDPTTTAEPQPLPPGSVGMEDQSTNGSSIVSPPPYPDQPPSPGTSPSAQPSASKLSLGAIIGIAAGCGVAVLALLGCFVFCCLRRKKQKRSQQDPKATKPIPVTAINNDVLGVQQYDGPTTARVA